MKPALKLPVILGSAAALAAAALLLGKPAPGAPPLTPLAPRVAVAPPPANKPDVAPVAKAEPGQPVIQIAVLLDTSGSMDGLLDQARTQLWNIVNRFSHAKRNGVTPQLQLALYVYGNTDPGSNRSEIRQVLPFTTDLDLLSEHLFSLRTSGGSEHCGEVIRDASAQLAWSQDPEAMRLIFIAGNEPFTQGPVKFADAVKYARERGITVNTIHCGGYEEGISGQWKDAAVLADGSYLNIDQNQRVVEIPAPQDEEIARLGAELNKTYVAYGASGQEAQMRQAAQDSNSLGVSLSNMVSRSVAKSSGNYSNESWDLVDAVKKNQVDLGSVRDEDLPEPMRGLDAAGRKAWLAAREQERAALQQRIQVLNTERQKFLVEARKQHAAQNSDTLEGAIGQVVQREAKKRHLTLE
ncbi:VWA domain-containing protein [Pyxidicoccus fallax]|uniref:VWA domain-containing protein n=1 Tax=Pyxidicoccus fallax TaxID=394095 RepID=A0A848LES7_9BACT|nr:vWA domain-containing protein [Pyxidicoccus fallax]NMO17257.1 VWA domain-containing protein [Pyxidicoccus fallax]NPC78966.1 VWA domain-containing protein [Pyxidicoccus fallax]